MAKTILFVDDEPLLIDALIARLEVRNFDCVHFKDMSSALQFIKKNKNVALVVTDIMMPSGMDFPDIDSSETGYFFIDKVIEELPRVGIVCLSVIGDQEKIRSLKRKRVVYLRKGETTLETAMTIIESKANGVYKFG